MQKFLLRMQIWEYAMPTKSTAGSSSRSRNTSGTHFEGCETKSYLKEEKTIYYCSMK